MRLFPVLYLVSALFLCDADSRADEYTQIPGVIHMDSAVSGGALTFEELADAAQDAGAMYAIVTDHDTQRVEYGIPPLRSLLKIPYSRPSIRTYGVQGYLDDIARVDSANPGILFMPGVEAVPFYQWERQSGGLTLRHLHRHLLVMGLDKPEAIGNLPSLATGYPRRITVMSILALLWIIPFVWSLVFLLKPGIRGRKRRFRLIGGLPVLIISAAFLANGWPYSEATIDQYSDPGDAPYQAVIDYVNRDGGLTFWAHPEAEYREFIGSEEGGLIAAISGLLPGGGIAIETAPYHHLLNDTRDYTGFAIFNEGRELVGAPGGLWDSLLKQYCRGTRDRQVWAIAELDMESRGDAGSAGECVTMALIDEVTPGSILDALRNGRMYCFAAFYSQKVRVKEYALLTRDRRAISGETLDTMDLAEDSIDYVETRLILDLDVTPGTPELDIVVIRDGDIIIRDRISTSHRWEIPLVPRAGMSYVRVAGYDHDGMQIALNPIFITGRAEQ